MNFPAVIMMSCILQSHEDHPASAHKHHQPGAAPLHAICRYKGIASEKVRLDLKGTYQPPSQPCALHCKDYAHAFERLVVAKLL